MAYPLEILRLMIGLRDGTPGRDEGNIFSGTGHRDGTAQKFFTGTGHRDRKVYRDGTENRDTKILVDLRWNF